MVRTIIAVVVALLVGVGVGFGAAKTRQPEAPVVTPKPAISEKDLAAVKRDNQRLQDEIASLEKNRSSLEAQLKRAKDMAAQTRAAADQYAAADAEGGQVMDEFLAGLAAVGADPRAAMNDRRRRHDDNGDGSPDSPPDRAEWQQRRQEMMTRFQEHVTDRLAQQYDASPDLESKQRISDLAAYNNQLFDLMDQMRSAETDEERQAIREQIRDTYTQTQNLINEQQNVILSQTAESLGLKTDAEKQAYAASVRQTMSNPFFSPMMGAGGFGDRGRGRGPGGPRGGD